jgi:hypothetical protein
MGQTAINRAARRAQRARVLGADPRCGRCGWAEQTALAKANGQILCYECRSMQKGRMTVEKHHIVGRDNDPATVALPGNLHRQLSDAQLDWAQALKTNADRDPLVWLAQACQGISDHVAWWARMLTRLALWLIAVAEALRQAHGVTWWTTLGVPSFQEVMAT